MNKNVPSDVLQDILFFDGDRQVLFILRSPHGVCDGDYSLYDGDLETTFTVDVYRHPDLSSLIRGTALASTVLKQQADGASSRRFL